LEAADTEICDFTGELAGQRKRLDDLLDGAAVVAYRYELGPYEPPRDGEHVFTLTADDRLTPAVYERVAVVPGDG
jgi:hypothetical protein